MRSNNINLNIDIKLETRKKLCIGAGGLPLKTIADINFLRLDDKLIIPASTIKGVLRTCMIKVAGLLGYTAYPYVHPDKIVDDDVTRLMGKPNEMGRVRVYNAILDYKETLKLSHVKINDEKRIAEEGGLFTIEYIPIGVTFDSRIEACDVNNDEMRLLLAAIMEINNARIGKGGLLSLEISKIEPGRKEIIGIFNNDKVISTILDNLIGDRHENI
jgi:CRISPR/Cas system CMR subunit Cmr4 (Cas7 group RAMP superfamily)